MKLVLDGRWMQQPMHGIGRYTLRLLQHLPAVLSPEDQVFVLYRATDFQPADFEPVNLETAKFETANPEAFTWIEVKAPLFSLDGGEIARWLQRLHPDCVHFPGFWKTAPSPCPWVMTLHDLIHLRPPVKLQHRLYYRVLHKQLLKAQKVLTVSYDSAKKISAWQPGLKDSISVTYPGVDTVAHPLPLPDSHAAPYFFYVGNAKPHKNTDLLFVAMQQCLQRLKHQQATPHLVMPHLVTVGLPQTDAPWHTALTGISDTELHQWYAHSLAVLLPSFEEGLGLPLLEAMAHKKPILASDIAVFREVLNGSGVCLNPREPSLWGRAMSAFFREEDPFLLTIRQSQRRIPVNRERFQWEQMARDTYAVYQQATL